MKNGIKIILLGTAVFGFGIFVGSKGYKLLLLEMINDKEYMSKIIVPEIEKKIGKGKLERMAKIFYEKDDALAVNGFEVEERRIH